MEPMMRSRAIRPIQAEGDVAYIELTKGFVAVIDAKDVPLVDGFNWFANMVTNTVYAARWQSLGGNKGRNIYMHREILSASGDLCVDHINCNGLDNRRVNLRFATKAQNAWNQRVSRNSKTGLKGISWHTRCCVWHARIKFMGKDIHLGSFKTPEAAHAAYADACEKFRGEFIRLS